MMRRGLLFFTFLVVVCLVQAKTLKVLAIGNSFSQDAVEQYLFELAKAQGDSLVIGNAYIGGCSIERHYNNLRNETAGYAYRKVIGGIRAEHKKVTLQQIIRDEPWDLITFQQASPLSGLPDSFVFLPSLIRLVKTYCSNLHAQFAWHMTWAYANDYASAVPAIRKELTRRSCSSLSIDTLSKLPCGASMKCLRTLRNDSAKPLMVFSL